ncbi:hypothetical protein V2J09_002695 [Rumex salicifolius]
MVTTTNVVKKFFVASVFMWMLPITVLYGFHHNWYPGLKQMSPESQTLLSGFVAVISVNMVIAYYIYMALKEPSFKHEPDPTFVASAKASINQSKASASEDSANLHVFSYTNHRRQPKNVLHSKTKTEFGLLAKLSLCLFNLKKRVVVYHRLQWLDQLLWIHWLLMMTNANSAPSVGPSASADSGASSLTDSSVDRLDVSVATLSSTSPEADEETSAGLPSSEKGSICPGLFWSAQYMMLAVNLELEISWSERESFLTSIISSGNKNMEQPSFLATLIM